MAELAALVWLALALGRRVLGWRLLAVWMLVVPGIPLSGALTYLHGPVVGLAALAVAVLLLRARPSSRAPEV